MSRHTTRVRASNDRVSLYTEITDKIIAELEAGRIPWVQPWGTAAIKAPLAMPRNASTQRGYSGINVLILWGAVIEHGFSGLSWLTFRQALGLGGHVRKGERGTTVVYADRFTPDDERRRAAEAGEEPGAIRFLKRFSVFNTNQCDGLPEEVAASAASPYNRLRARPSCNFVSGPKSTNQRCDEGYSAKEPRPRSRRSRASRSACSCLRPCRSGRRLPETPYETCCSILQDGVRAGARPVSRARPGAGDKAGLEAAAMAA
jgi:hypothetical protein